MKKLLVGMILLLGVVAVVNAEEAAPAQDMGVTVDLSYTTISGEVSTFSPMTMEPFSQV